ncbi:MAG: type IV pilus modification PilV family protein [Bacteroidota bacterium]
MSIKLTDRNPLGHQSGMSLIELIVAIVITSVGIAGVLSVFSNAIKSSADPLLRKQMQAIAEEMMDEISIKPYTAAANAAPAGCARNTYNDVSDYDGYTTTGKICDIDGNAIAALASYSVSIAVSDDAGTFAAYGVGDTKKITVTVTNDIETVTLIGWRTNYAS